jgi:two-component sensor histidine kinase
VLAGGADRSDGTRASLDKISQDNIQLNITIDNIFFDIETAIPCGLIINELISNSLKHAFPATCSRRFENKNRQKRSFFDPKIADFEGSSIPANYVLRPENENQQISNLQLKKVSNASKSLILKTADSEAFSIPANESCRPKDFQCANHAANTTELTNSLNDHCTKKNEINIKLTKVDENFVLSIDDNGTGLPHDFDFQNTTSLGLQLVNSLVDQLDGTITLDTTRGTNFKIIFKEMKYKKRL